MDETSDTCLLTHKLFASFGDVAFRRSDADGAPVMAIKMGEVEAAIPLHSLQREFSIDDASADGRMLGLVEQSLDFVSVMRLGDRLPAEVLGAGASWTPSARCREVACTRLQRQLVAWLARNGGDVSALGSDAVMQAQLNQALAEAARAIGASGPQGVVDLIESLADELAYVESLRETLLRRVEMMSGKIDALASIIGRGPSLQEKLSPVRRLAGLARQQLRGKFQQIDSQTSDVMSALRNTHVQRAYVRSHRDWLYRTSRAWSPLLDEWARAGNTLDEFALALLDRTYRFLAPRYMPVSEWLVASRQPAPKPEVVQW